MAQLADKTIHFSLFMFTVGLRPDDEDHIKALIGHIKVLAEMGYDGIDLPIPAISGADHASEIESYKRLKQTFDAAGLDMLQFATNVGTTRDFDPTSLDTATRKASLAYLKSRVDITAIMGGRTVMAGPIIFPYGVFPSSDAGIDLWSDALQDWFLTRHDIAWPVLAELADYATGKGIKLAVEPVTHWETPGPNMVSDVLEFLVGIDNPTLGLTVDVAHVMLGSSGPQAYAEDMRNTVAQKRLHSVHISAPDRGSVADSWIPWKDFLGPILPHCDGPYLVEVFNAIEPFWGSQRLSRRKFWIPGEDEPKDGRPSAYDIARDGLAMLKQQMQQLGS